jgi:2,4-dienoyl-CoA reductase-like NADH-dependent reductase (Old Yellow Enzyme family)
MHERFRYSTKDELIAKGKELGLEIPYLDDISALFRTFDLGGFRIANRMVVQPMEGYDSEKDGAPSWLTKRRYFRYAEGGSGIIWYEAVSVMHEGRSNPHQLWIHGRNFGSFARLNDEVRKNAIRQGMDPYLVVQLTHSGRYSKPDGVPKPLVAGLNPDLDKSVPYILTDDDLKRIIDRFVDSAKLAYRAGFNAVDLKACHGYLFVDALASRGRKESIFGGEEPERRFRLLLETYDRIHYEIPDILITVRLGVSDLYSGGFGVDEKGFADFSEPLMLAGHLSSRGIRLMNLTMGSPYHNPHVNRPFDNPVPGQTLPDEHPLSGVMRMIEGTALFQSGFPEIAFTGSAYSFLRHHAPNIAAAVIEEGKATFAGFGRNSFAYPSMPADLKKNGTADPRKFCITCSGCTRLIRGLRPGGCVIHDREIYGNELKKLIADGK